MRRRGSTTPVVLLVAMLAFALAGCGDRSTPAPHLQWRSGALPVPSGDRAVVRAATWCADRWVVAGATADGRGGTRPSVWTSPDATRWRALRLHPRHDYYAARAILTSIGCSDGRIAALGAKSGGAHGNPRIASWRERADGSLAAVPAAFELFGGPEAVGIGRLTGGPAGYLIAGTRTSGAAVWTSRSGHGFVLHERAPGLAATGGEHTAALDAVAWHGGWMLVGTGTDATGHLGAVAWRGGADGTWRRAALPGGDVATTAERIAATRAGPVAVGLDEPRFAVWAWRGERWTPESGFGRVAPGGTSAPYVSGLAWTGSQLITTYADGVRFRAAFGPPGHLVDVPLPEQIALRGDHAVTVAAHGSAVLLLTVDGVRGRVWLARAPS